MKFLNDFADALHAHNLILTVFIDGCCGYTNPFDTSNRGCKGAEAKYDYQVVQQGRECRRLHDFIFALLIRALF